MEGVSQEQFSNTMDRVFQKMDKHHQKTDESIKNLAIEVVEIKTRMEMTEIPVIPKRPCKQLKLHLEEHERTIDMFRKPFISALVGGAVVAVFSFLKTHGGTIIKFLTGD